MPLPTPSLDDRRFQDLVDEAKRFVQRHCPEWTDHNVSDPGVTLIETFAFMVEQLSYRLNRVPDRLYVKFLELLGLRLLPPTPARAPVTFWLTTSASGTLVVRAGTRASTLRTESDESVVFSTLADLAIVPTELIAARSEDADGKTAAHTEDLELGTEFPVFGQPPAIGDLFLIGLNEPAPSCALRIDYLGETRGIGVNPKHPPLEWEAWDGSGWAVCPATTDETGGLNKAGRIVVHLPDGHAASVVGGERAGWLRVRVTEPLSGQTGYSESPVVRGLTVSTVGGTAQAVNAELVESELLGAAEGVPGQRFPVRRRPVLAGREPVVLEVGTDDGWQEWTAVEHFAASAPDDRHFLLDAVAGEVELGPAVRLPDGGVRQYGAIPPRGAAVRVRRYLCGGGTTGNVATGTISTLKSSIPFVAGVVNLRPAQGGVDGETLDEAKARGPIMLRTRSRAVTAEDYEAIATEAAPEAARVHCLTAGEGDVGQGTVKVLVVPAVTVDKGRIDFEDLVPAADTLRRVAEALDKVRLVGTKVLVEPPKYRGVTVVARLVARPRVSVDAVAELAREALYEFLNPLTGGDGGQGWTFGRKVLRAEIFGLLQRVRGVDVVEDVRMFGADPVTRRRGEETAKLPVGKGGLVFSFDHQIRVEET
ncbi:putative baseplate assembly protein [Amycolatopsis sp. cg5]|uniref:putative baseplate assembly protein n=1 Tax=Amycolatopsis sp. cg5 TaxID=3238802 RepID=UPI0035244501